MPLNIRFILNIISIFLLIFFSVFLLTRRGQNRYSNLLLAAFLIINSIPFLFSALAILEIRIFSRSPTLYLSFYTLDFLMGPVIFFYTKSLTQRDFSFRKRDWLHLLPVMIFHLYLLSSILIKQSIGVSSRYLYWEITLTLLVSHLILVVYALKSIQILRRYADAIKNIYSYTEKINFSWLRFVLMGFGTIWVTIISNGLVRVAFRQQIPYIRDFMTVASLIVSISIIYHGLTRPKLFSDTGEKPKYRGSPLTASDIRLYATRLEEYMISQKPHLIPQLTINHLSEKLKIHPKHLSQLINETFRQNFFDFINSYRIQEAKKHLSRSNQNLNISRILHEAGFNSKAAFNRAFSRHAGMSPREFRKQALNPSAKAV
jgi:AraC-like DNA-binding protein